ncbi:DNA ligase D [Rubrolithibacter danxiaensis]|uniref:DNA ligase D n=1 Tax=Rubrolithibacter danxiaensis TaxID=3390805 RepID=UPI003BF82265
MRTTKKSNTAPAATLVNETGVMPQDLKPMLATLVDKAFDEEGWIYEIKWDGYRAMAYIKNGTVELKSRNNNSFNEKFYPIRQQLEQWNTEAVVDGEITVLNEKGIADFSALQTWRSEADGELFFYLFDIIWYKGRNLMERPLKERRELLESIIPDEGNIKLSKSFDAKGTDFFKVAEKMGLEGIIAKKIDSFYFPDTRSKEWLKIKTEKHQELIIGGYTKNENTSRQFSALLLGIFENNEFKHVCPVGTGFSDKLQTEILEKLKPLIIPECPFNRVPEYNKPSRFRPNPPKATVTWVKPEVVVEISYRELTKDGAVRHPSFKGLREDKNAKEVVREKPADTNEVIDEAEALHQKKVISRPGKKIRKSLLNPGDETQVREVNGHELKFTNLSKIFWPDEKISKRDMLNYYYQVAPYMLPYLVERPQTLNRFPNGIYKNSFYQKDVTGKVPSWIETFRYYSEADQRYKNFMVCTNEASLLYIASLGCIEINPWSSRCESPDNPDWCIIDLDPDKNPFEQVIETAQITKRILDESKITSYCKTSGSTGLHIYIPLAAKYTYEQSKEFGRLVAKIVHSQLPDYTSIERLTEKRKGKLYIDFLQNRPQATVAAPYSLRPKPGATVSMPLHWDEVKIGLQMKDFTIFNAMSRIKEQGDIFKPVLGKGINMEQAIKKLEGLLQQ